MRAMNVTTYFLQRKPKLNPRIRVRQNSQYPVETYDWPFGATNAHEHVAAEFVRERTGQEIARIETVQTLATGFKFKVHLAE